MIASNARQVKTAIAEGNNASTVSYINPEPASDNYVFYNITTDNFKKSKVGVFLKKVKRVVDRNDPLKHIFSGEEKAIAKQYF